MIMEINSIISQAYQYVNNKITTNLTPLQQKVNRIATAIFQSLTESFSTLLHRPFRAKLVEKEEIELVSKPLDVSIKVQRNLRFAQIQQEKEEAKGFSITQDPLLTHISVSGKKKLIQHEEKEINGNQVGVGYCEGLRSTMEDSHLATSLQFSVNGKNYHASVFGVFDGHGGADAARFVEENLPHLLTKALKKHNKEALTDEGIWKALRACFKELDAKYEGNAGTTATVALLLENKVWIANSGDSRTVLSHNEKAIQLTEDAKPEIERYRRKIEKLGGTVLNGRVMGVLAVAGTIGDKQIKGTTGQTCVSPNPQITNYSLDEVKKGYLILACDGLYHVATTDEVVQAVSKMDAQGQSMGQMAKRLVQSAILTHHSRDNVSVMIIKLPNQ